MWCCLGWLVEGAILHDKIYVLVLAAFLLPVRIYPAHLTYEFVNEFLTA